VRRALFAAAALALGCSAPPDPAPVPEVPLAPLPPVSRPAAPPEDPVRALDTPVPEDVTVHVKRATEGRLQVQVKRKGHVVALRRGAGHRNGDGEAAIEVAAAGDTMPIVWETTDPVTLVTTRGLVEIDAGGGARLRLVAPPEVIASETRRLHACRAHDDPAGGFAVICRVRGFASAVNVTEHGAPWIATSASRTMLRFDLAPEPGAADAVVLGYADGVTGVVVRAEASRVAGEDRPAIVIQSAERAQPSAVVPFAPHIRHPGRFVDFDF
jgi:hypothetical protein